MKEQMTSRERLMVAIANGKPDRVPAIPDFSNMIPVKMTGKPFWEVYLRNTPTLYVAYCRAAEYYGIDGWHVAYDAVRFKRKDAPEVHQKIISRTADRIVERIRYETQAGDLEEEMTYPLADPPTKTEKMVKDLKTDFAKVRHLYHDIESYDASLVPEYRKMCGEHGVFTLCTAYPGMQYWLDFFNEGLSGAIFAQMDYPEIFDEWREIAERSLLQETEILLDQKPDLLLLGGSGTLTLASPKMVRQYALPTIRKICRMAKQAGVLTMLHSCGKSMALVEMLANETELNCVNPLEAPPMGDADLREVKRLYGDKLSLMGNLQTSQVMLLGSVEDVERAAKQAIDDAAAGGGFLLSTGDQCGRDTPPENIFKLVEVAKTYGRYS